MNPTNRQRQSPKQDRLDPLALTVPGAAGYSSLSISRLYELMKAGELQSFKVGGRRMIYRSAVDDLFAKLSGAA